MSNVYFISDLHLGHKRILEFSGAYRDGRTVDEHDEILVDRWNSAVNKRALVYVLGDVCFDERKLPLLNRMVGRKVLVRGNHDKLKHTEQYLEYFDEVYGFLKYKDHWVSHAPIHPVELRGRGNIHGHTHTTMMRLQDGKIDTRYINVCVEHVRGVPINYQDIKSGRYWLVWAEACRQAMHRAAGTVA